MLHARAVRLIAVGLVCALAACDKDPSIVRETLALQGGCPADAHDVNTPITLDFTVPVLAASVSPANVVVTDAVSGNQIPGAISQASPSQIVFTPSAPFGFNQAVRVRLQNLLSAATQTQMDVTQCQFLTSPPPIAEVVWKRLPNAGGDNLRGASLPATNVEYTLNVLGVLFRRDTGDFMSRFQNPYFNAGFDIDFISPSEGYAAFNNQRTRQSIIMHTMDGGATFDSVGYVDVNTLQRTYFDTVGGTTFGVVAGGNTANALFMKYTSAGGWTTQNDNGAGYVQDVDFATGDTTKGAAVTNGIKVGSFDMRGQLFVSSDGGTTWSRPAIAGGSAGMPADSLTQTYFGVAVRADGSIYVAGGGGFFARLTPGAGGYTVTRMPLGIAVPDTTNPLSLLYTDVEFAPDNDQVGWVIGAQQTGTLSGVPQYRGLIFMTRDGGATWTRQGVIDAPNYGAEFPKLNRLSVLNATAALLVGDGGTVLMYQP